jgi:hypothetical protein
MSLVAMHALAMLLSHTEQTVHVVLPLIVENFPDPHPVHELAPLNEYVPTPHGPQYSTVDGWYVPPIHVVPIAMQVPADL